MGQLKQVAGSLQCSIKKFRYIHNVSWVASKVGTLKDWKCVTVHLGSATAEGSSVSAAAAKHLLRRLSYFKFVYMLHFRLDYPVIFSNPSLLF
jgi:hypothetical protein